MCVYNNCMCYMLKSYQGIKCTLQIIHSMFCIFSCEIEKRKNCRNLFYMYKIYILPSVGMKN